MILVNKKQVTPMDLEKVLGIKLPMEKILKKPLFEINPALIIADPANGVGATRVRQGMEFPAYFRVRLKSGENVEIRYCTNRVPDVKTHGQTEIYTPKKLPFEGKAEFLDEDEDKAAYYYLHYYNRQSPFRAKGYEYEGKPFEYEFQDDQAKATEQIEKIHLRSKATAHAASLQGEELMIIAKGMRIEGVHGLDPLMVRAKLMEYAESRPTDYLQKAESQVNHIEGLIFDAIDKGIFIADSQGSSKRWIWAMGVKKGELIVELPNSVPNHKLALITHIQQTPGAINEFLPVLLDTRKVISAKANITEQLKGVDILGMIKGEPTKPIMPVEPEDSGEEQEADGELPFPTTFRECSPYLKQNIGKGDPILAGKLWNAIKEKTLNEDNLADFLSKLREVEPTE